MQDQRTPCFVFRDGGGGGGSSSSAGAGEPEREVADRTGGCDGEAEQRARGS
jgi:hypothetical protein